MKLPRRCPYDAFWMSAAASVHVYVDNLRHASYGSACLIIVRAQLLVFIVDQTKIGYRCDKNDPFQVWLLFALFVATQYTAARSPSMPEESNWIRHRSHRP